MTEPAKLTPQEVEMLADKFVERLFERLKDEKVVNEVTEVWGAHFDKHLGRTVRRGFYLVLIAVFAFVGIKLDAFVGFFKA
jgi:hypothetical protein